MQINFEEPAISVAPGAVVMAARFDLATFNKDSAQALKIALPDSAERWPENRQGEFLAGRYLAACALEKLGASSKEVGFNNKREPVWPPNVVGSITHTSNYASCAVAFEERYVGLGLDCERILDKDGASASFYDVIGSDDLPGYEILLEDLKNKEVALTVICSIKEAIFKCLYPLIKKRHYYDAARVTFANDGMWVAKVPLAKDVISSDIIYGSYSVGPELVHAGCVIRV